jgi:hypothetical protein
MSGNLVGQSDSYSVYHLIRLLEGLAGAAPCKGSLQNDDTLGVGLHELIHLLGAEDEHRLPRRPLHTAPPHVRLYVSLTTERC